MLNQGNDILPTVVTIIYYIIVGFLALLSLFGVYILGRHGRSRVIAITASLAYIFVFLSLAAATQVTLYSIF